MSATRPLPDAAGGAPFAALAPVLLASDGHATTDDTASLARWVADRLGAPLAVVTALPTTGIPPLAAELPLVAPLVAPPTEPTYRADTRATVRANLEPVLGPSHAWPLDIAAGPVGGVVCEVARDRRAALVVVGRGRRRVVDRLVAGTALEIVRHAPVPVLAALAGQGPVLRRAVVGVDFSPSSVAAAHAAVALVAPGADIPARVLLVHVAAWADGPTLTRPRQADDDAAALERLRAALTLAAPDGVVVETRHLSGDVVDALRTVADAAGAELIAVGTHGPAWLERLLVGSVAEGVLRDAHTHVLVCPEPGVRGRGRG